MDADGRAKVPCRDHRTDDANVAAQDASAGTPGLEPEGHPPGSDSIRDYLVYGLSLPERAIRSTAGVVGGALRESAAALFRRPSAMRGPTNSSSARCWTSWRKTSAASPVRTDRKTRGSQNYVARKTVGNFVEMASLATVHVSPMLLLAIVSDLAYGSKAYLGELAEELPSPGRDQDASAIRQVDDLLEAAASASEETAAAFDTPPLSIEGLRENRPPGQGIAARHRSRPGDPEDEIRQFWDRMRSVAQREDMSPLAISGAMTLGSLDRFAKLGSGALTSVRVAGSLFDGVVLDHYRTVLTNIDEHGLYSTLSASSQPYAEALWRNFSADRATVTERFLDSGAAARALGKARRWLKSTIPRS